MSEQADADTMRDYFQRVMDDWRPRQAQAHPYAENATWKRNYVAMQGWVQANGLEHGRVLEVGCGTGLLQDLVVDYVGVDVAASSAAFMHKPFLTSSATCLPFPDNSFDGAFSVWVLEHIEQPEAMLAEMRRVVRPGGTLFLVAAYAVAPWVSQGVHRRPWRELSPHQRLTKLSIPLRASAPYRIATTLARRSGDLIGALGGRPTRLRYGRLIPNFEHYWDYDADACVSLDAYSVALYFVTRGDTPLYPVGLLRGMLLRARPQIYRINK
ncbi:class I SAM-dependent methyltransferase [Chloroflexales bacterium ZM16-3]|nr:class I SAM-dependent methyltransferase [Chloroflexales bacterium ZM16-3]